MHSNTAVNVDEQKKPHMYYNQYETEVNTMDQMEADIPVTDERRDGHLQYF